MYLDLDGAAVYLIRSAVEKAIAKHEALWEEERPKAPVKMQQDNDGFYTAVDGVFFGNHLETLTGYQPLLNSLPVAQQASLSNQIATASMGIGALIFGR